MICLKQIRISFRFSNIYALFMAMSCHLLKKEGQFVFITPRSWTSGLYFKRFRKYLLDNLSIKRMHLFVSREKVFGMESVLQETMILYGEKTELQQREICIAICNDAEDYGNLRILNVKASVCLPGPENYYVLIPADQEDIAALKFLSEMENEPRKSGYLFKTGQVVEFRNRDDTVTPLCDIAILEHNREKSQSEKNAYRLTNQFAILLKAWGTEEWEDELEFYRHTHQSYKERYSQIKKIEKGMDVKFGGEEFHLERSSHNKLQKEILEVFAPNFVSGSILLYLGDTKKRELKKDEEMQRKIIVHCMGY